MNTILTDDEIKAECRNGYGIDPLLGGNLMEFCRAIEAAVLAKLAQQEPVAWWYMRDVEQGISFSPDQDANKDWQPLYTHPAPQQADRQRVPQCTQSELNGWFLSLPEGRQKVLVEDKWLLASAAFEAGKAAPEAPAPAVVQVPQSLTDEEIMRFLEPWHTQGDPEDRRDLIKSVRALLVANQFAPALSVYDEIEADLPYLMGRASQEGHEVGQILAAEVQRKIRQARAAAPEAPAQGEQADEQGVDVQGRRIAAEAENHACSLAVWMTRMDAESPGADDLGVSGWLQEAEDRIKRRMLAAAPEAPAQASAVDERDRKDAERYRWLREHATVICEDSRWSLALPGPYNDGDEDASLDAAIDAALAQKGGK